MAETKKMVVSPKIEIDTSPPFESVKEAVNCFDGGSPWISRPVDDPNPQGEEYSYEDDVKKMEEQAVKLEREIVRKQQEILNFSKDLVNAQLLLESLKLSLQLSRGFSLRQAQSDLRKTSVHLAQLQASVENKLRHDDQGRNEDISSKPRSPLLYQLKYEADQFNGLIQASRYEVLMAISEIERTRNSIKMAEMRLNAARKMEEAAQALEAISLMEKDQLSRSQGITISYEEYTLLTQKAKQAEKLSRLEETIKQQNVGGEGDNSTKFKTCNLHKSTSVANAKHRVSGFKTMASTGEGVGRKFIVKDDLRSVDNYSTRGHVTLRQILRERSEVILHPSEITGDRNLKKHHYFVQRKKFGFIQVPFPLRRKLLPM